LPAVPVAIWIAAVVVPGVPAYSGVPRAWRYSLVVRGAAIAVLVAATVLTFQQMQYWRDSVALWTRAVEIDPQSDVALYNLASALARTGLRRESIERYDEVLRLLPDQADARRNRDLLRAAELEQLANGLAASGDLDAAIAQYRAAIALDSARTHSQAALGMALAQTGRPAEALPHLREAVRLGAADPAIANALAFSLVETGGTSEACRVLEAAREKFPEDVNVARNLKQLQGACGR
jgi:tetratricopeptide (TPR) repeat protein